MDPSHLVDFPNPRTYGRLGRASSITIVDSSRGRVARYDNIDDNEYRSSFKPMQGAPVKERAIFIERLQDRSINITSALFTEICEDYSVPSVFRDGLSPGFKFLGYGHFSTGSNPNQPESLHLYYSVQMLSWRDTTFIFTRFDYRRNTTFHLVLNPHDCSQLWFEQAAPLRAHDDSYNPFGLHVLLLYQAQKSIREDVLKEREDLMHFEKGGRLQSGVSRDQIRWLHNLTQRMHIVAENCASLAETLEHVKASMRQFSSTDTTVTKQALNTDGQLLDHVLAACAYSRRWALNYRDRANIQTALGFHLSQQRDNELNLNTSKSMATIAIVTLVFLPATFVAAIFGMAFFSEADGGNGGIRTSKDIWWYFVITIPGTLIVLGIWRFWPHGSFTKLDVDEEWKAPPGGRRSRASRSRGRQTDERGVRLESMGR